MNMVIKTLSHLLLVCLALSLMVGCASSTTPPPSDTSDQYDLSTSSTIGGNVTTPGEGTYTYNASQVVDLAATADANYHFVNWTGGVGTVADVNLATTNITMNGNYSIVANFAISGPADRVDVIYFHRTQRCYVCYYAEDGIRYTVETYFADELANGKVTFQVVNVQDEENAAIVNKYGAYTLSLFINTIRGGTDHIEEVTDIWYLIGDDEAFVEVVRDKIEKSLKGEE